jgi:hypothetical protein
MSGRLLPEAVRLFSIRNQAALHHDQDDGLAFNIDSIFYIVANAEARQTRSFRPKPAAMTGYE